MYSLFQQIFNNEPKQRGSVDQYRKLFLNLGITETPDLLSKINEDIAYILSSWLECGPITQDPQIKLKYVRFLCEHPQYTHAFKTAVEIFRKASLLTQDNFLFLFQHASNAVDAVKIADMLVQMHSWGIPKSIGIDDVLIETLKTLNKANLMPKHYADFASIQTSKDIYQRIICSENTEDFNNYLKIASFFMAYHKKLKKSLYSQEIHRFLSEMKPLSLKNNLIKILTKLGGYNFMPEEEENITLGVEIEYSNIPIAYRALTEFVMRIIQKGWSHPGDYSVKLIGENTYPG